MKFARNFIASLFVLAFGSVALAQTIVNPGGSGSGGTPGGSNTQLQYNNSGAFGGAAGTVWNNGTSALTLPGSLFIGNSTAGIFKQAATDYIESVTGFSMSAGGTSGVSMASGGFTAGPSAVIGFSSSNGVGTRDVILGRAGAASLRLGDADAAAPVAQTLGVQSVVAGTANTAGAKFTIKGSAGTGTGNPGNITFAIAPAGSSGSAQNAFSDFLTLGVSAIGTTRSMEMIAASGGQSLVISNNTYGVTPSVQWTLSVGGVGVGFFSSAGGYSAIAPVSFSRGANNAPDLFLYRDAANTLALRNGTAAQTFNIYNTYTDASNYERGEITWSGNQLYIGTQKLGTGSARQVNFEVGGTTAWSISTGFHLLAGSDKTYDFGSASAAARDVFFGRNLIPTATFSTSQTTGFINIPGAAGTPSGVPSNTTGFPFYYDSTNNKICVYNGSWRCTAALT